MTFHEYKMSVLKSVPPKDIRYGQHAFNMLTSANPRVAEIIRGSLSDPFNRDARLPAFWEVVEKNW